MELTCDHIDISYASISVNGMKGIFHMLALFETLKMGQNGHLFVKISRFIVCNPMSLKQMSE